MKELLTFDSSNTQYGIDCVVSNIGRMYIVKNLSSIAYVNLPIKWFVYREMHSDLWLCWRYFFAVRYAANKNI